TAIVASPRHGVITRIVRRRRLATSVALDDLLAARYRADESGQTRLTIEQLGTLLVGRPVHTALARATRASLVNEESGAIALTDGGRQAARDIVRRHRLWEHYLVDEAGFAPDHVHAPAERLEHVATEPPPGPDMDPHGRQIP
ncbi:MAG: iron dependent repressor, metal binding and dimerization domain protein, partial [Planctomycetota bacterium]